jgi:DNA polymerase (family 10)
MAMMDRTGVARSLEQIAAYLDFKGENPFRVRAFNAAARSILGFAGDLDAGIDDGSLAATKGIGPAILAIVTELVRTGRASMLDSLQAEVPAGLVDMMGIPGLGVSKIRVIQETLGIETLPELEAAARDGRLAALPRFGERTAACAVQGRPDSLSP